MQDIINKTPTLFKYTSPKSFKRKIITPLSLLDNRLCHVLKNMTKGAGKFFWLFFNKFHELLTLNNINDVNLNMQHTDNEVLKAPRIAGSQRV